MIEMPHFSCDLRNVGTGRVSESRLLASLDGLRGVTNCRLDVSALIKESRPDSFGKGHIYRMAEGRGGTLWFRVLEDGRVTFSLNPKWDENGWKTQDFISARLGPEGLRASIRDVTCALTAPCSFRELFMGLDLGRRRSILRYDETSKGHSFYAGKVGRRYELTVYDKTKEMRSKAEERGDECPIDFQCTRVEILYSPEPSLTVADLPLIAEHEPFGGMSRYKVTFRDPDPAWPQSVLQRYVEFKLRCERDNFWVAKKAINKNGKNFSKQYGQFFELEECQPTLDEMFRHGIRGFFPQ